MKLLNKDELIAKEIKYMLQQEHTAEGKRLPSERELAARFGVQRATLRLALQSLEREGIVASKKGSGYYVCPARINEDLQEILSLSDRIHNMGKKLENELLSFEKIEADKDLALKMMQPLGLKLSKITRVRSLIDTGGVLIPIGIDYAYIPEDVAPKLIQYDVEKRSLFEILKTEYGITPSSDRQWVEIVYANKFEEKYLKVSGKTPLIKKEGMTYDKDGRMIQYAKLIKNKNWIEFKQSNPIIDFKLGDAAHGL